MMQFDDGQDPLSKDEEAAVAALCSVLADLNLIELPKAELIPEEPFEEPFVAEAIVIPEFIPRERSLTIPEPAPSIQISPEEAFAALQTLLIDPKLSEVRTVTHILAGRLQQLQRQIYEPDQLIELLLPTITELLQRKIEQSQEEIATAIAPTMGSAIKKQVEIEEDQIVDALYPIIGGTISKYLAETVREINQQVENTFSVEGVQRKIRAKIQGVSEAELILKEAMPFAVQAIFLIHKTSGLVIAEVQPDEHKLESDMVAGMLTAIQSFANDCIAQSDRSSELHEIDYGSSKIILEVAGYCYLAIVLRGNPPRSFILKIRQVLSRLVQQHSKAIEQFDGDSESVPSSIPTLLEGLVESSIEAKKKPPALLILGLGIAAIVGIPWSIAAYHDHLRQQIETALSQTPELSVYHLTASASWRKFELKGRLPNAPLREKADFVARSTVPNWNIQNSILVVETPADPVIVAQSVKQVTTVLNQTPGIAIAATYINDQATVSGVIQQKSDAQKIMQAYRQIKGVKSVLSTIQVSPVIKELRFYFQPNSATPDSVLEPQLTAFLQQHPNRNFRIIGYSSDLQLAFDRSTTIQKLLLKRGMKRDRLPISASNTLPPNVTTQQSEQLKRSVILEAMLD